MPQTFVYLTKAGRIETEVDMNNVCGWEAVNVVSCLSRSNGSVHDPASYVLHSEAVKNEVQGNVACADMNNAKTVSDPKQLERYLKRKFDEEKDTIEGTQLKAPRKMPMMFAWSAH